MSKRYVVKRLPAHFPYVWGVLDCAKDRFVMESFQNQYGAEQRRNREFVNSEAAEYFADKMNAKVTDD